MSKRILIVLAIAAFTVMPLAGHADPSADGCVVLAGQGESSATITAASASGIIAGGTWSVHVVHADQSTNDYFDTHGIPRVIPDVLRAGDQITCSADEGMVLAGGVGA